MAEAPQKVTDYTEANLEPWKKPVFDLGMSNGTLQNIKGQILYSIYKSCLEPNLSDCIAFTSLA